MNSHRCSRTTLIVIGLASCFLPLLIVFRIHATNIHSLLYYQTETTSEKSNEDLQCPVSSKDRKYAQANIDTALFDKFWSNPIKCFGTFVELGAFDGNSLSNTKFLEEYLGWNGVLIEAFAQNYKKLKKNRQKTYNYNVAICPESQGHVDFIGKGATGGIVDKLSKNKIKQFKLAEGKRLRVPCEPIGPLLRKSKIKKIDLFSLDVEGAEMMVLQTMDWSIPIHVFIIEMEGTTQTNKLIRNIMKSNGFVEIKSTWDINTYGSGVNNEVFINPNYEDVI